MQDDHFEWDDHKAAQNYAKHGVGFRRASLAFADLFGIEGSDDGAYGEERYWTIGMVEGALIYVVYTERQNRIRIISARQATKSERNDYFTQNVRRP